MQEPTRSRVPALLLEAHRRGVTLAAVGYCVGAFALYQVVSLLTALFVWPLRVLEVAGELLVLGFIPIVIFGWMFVLTPRAARRREAPVVAGDGPEVRSRLVRVVIVGVAIFGVATWLLRPREGAITRGAEVVTILPFTVAGEGVNHLSEGLVDLLAINLGEVAPLRITNRRIALRRYRDSVRRGAFDGSSGALPALARDLGAGAVLTGGATVSGAELELTAVLDRTDGWRMAEARVVGPRGELLELVDDLSDALILAIWRTRASPPESDVRRLTTDDPEALNHYLRGEALFRRGQWRAAANGYARALRADTAFALAYSRLADTYGWADGVFTERALANSEAAHRLADRLPARDRRLAAARWRAGRDASDPAPADSLRALLDDYPDDLEALHVLGEVGFHQRPLYSLGLDELLEPVERLLAVDSTMTAGLIHPIEATLQFADEARFERYLGLAEAARLPGASDYRRIGEALWSAPETRDEVARELMADRGSAFTYVVGAYRVDVGSPVDFRGGLEGVLRLVPAERKEALWSIRTLLLTSTGRLSEARDTARLDVVPDETVRAHLEDYPLIAGFTPPADAARRSPPVGPTLAQAEGSSPPWQGRLARALGHLASGDAARGVEALDDLEAEGLPEALEPVARGLLEAARGWASLLAGDTAAAVERMQRGLERAGRWTARGVNTEPSDGIGSLGPGAALSFRLVAAMASWGPTREQGRRLLRDVLWPDLHYEVLRHFEMGVALERAGESLEARRSYDRFVRLLEGADGGSRVPEEVARARAAVIRLGG